MARISPAEARARFQQAASKRFDLISYRLGLAGQTEPSLTLPDLRPSLFGLSPSEAARRALLLRQHLPQAADDVIHEADRLCRHQFDLLGYKAIEYEPAIDWHWEPINNKRAPLKPWFRIKYLEFDEVGDHKIIWELNRHQYLVTLAKAWCLTGNQDYWQEIVAQWYAWRESNPYPLGVNWASALEVAFRSLSWLWVRELLRDCPDIPSTFAPEMLRGLQSHGRYIERYLSTYFSPNTHLIGEAAALFFLGTLCPEIPAAERWKSQGWGILLQEAERQVRSDGVYFEQALYYHVYALDFFLHARKLAQQIGQEIPGRFDQTIKNMLDVVAALSNAGPIEGFGDDDGGRLFNPRRNRVEHLKDPLALGAVIYGCDKYSASGLTEESIWLCGDDALEFIATPRTSTHMESTAFPAGGIYLMNDHQPCAQQLMVDAGPQGTGRSGHGHADALSVRVSVNGRRILVDSGTYCYISGDDSRGHFRGTGAHNTLRVDGLDQAVADGPFAWKSIPEVKAEQWLTRDTFDLFCGSHNGYSRFANPVLHRRLVFHVKGGPWFIRDLAEGRGNHVLETFWHFSPELVITATSRPSAFFAVPVESPHDSASPTAILFEHNSAWKIESSEGFVSPAYGLKCAAPVIRTEITAALPQDTSVLLLPQVREEEIGTFIALDRTATSGARGYRYQTDKTVEFIFVASTARPWSCGAWSSDASLLYCKLRGAQLVHVIMVSGSFAEYRNLRFVSLPVIQESFEWSDRPQQQAASSSQRNSPDPNVFADFEVVDSLS